MNVPFPDGHSPILNKDRTIVCKGILDKTLKDKKVILRGLSETDILEIRQIILEEIKRQNDTR